MNIESIKSSSFQLSSSEKVEASQITNKILSTAWRRAAHEIHNYYIYFISLSDKLESSFAAFTNSLQTINENYPSIMKNESISSYYVILNTSFDSTRLAIAQSSKIVEKAMEFYEKYVSYLQNLHNQIFTNIRTSISPKLTECTNKHYWNLTIALEGLYFEEGQCYVIYTDIKNQFIEKVSFQLAEIHASIVIFSNHLVLCSVAVTEVEALTCMQKTVGKFKFQKPLNF